MFNFTFSLPTSVLVSLAALAGVTLHDTKLDRLVTGFAGSPVIASAADGSHRVITNDTHPHVERVQLREVSASQPRIMPRSEQKRYMLQKNTPKGTHFYDGYNLPHA